MGKMKSYRGGNGDFTGGGGLQISRAPSKATPSV